ncbi:MAG TPA: Holliday junction resolvase RuvX [Anaerolineaceae bacterium]|nr:Holliday junction resolvase RuvX [Anaerolineaceae bacterium]
MLPKSKVLYNFWRVLSRNCGDFKLKYLCVDPGEVRIGIAISDETGSLARPLAILGHVSRVIDAMGIMQLALENQVDAIVVGQALDSNGKPGPKARSAARLAEALRVLGEMPVYLWDESYSSQKAAELRIAKGISRKKRAQPIDDLAAAVILQDFLEHYSGMSETNGTEQ